MQVLLPENLPHVGSLDELMRSNVPALWPCIEPEDIRRKPFLSIGETTWDFADDQYLRDSILQCNGWALVRVQNAVLRWDGIFTQDGDAVLVSPPWHVSEMIRYFDPPNVIGIRTRMEAHFKQRPPCEAVVIEEPCAIFGHGPHGHWLYEAFLPLAVWEKIGLTPTLLYEDSQPPYREDLLNLAGYPKNKRQPRSRLNRDYQCKEFLALVPWRTRTGQLLPLHTGWTTDGKYCYPRSFWTWWYNASSTTMNFTQALGAKAPVSLGRGEKIFVHREGTATHRICANESEAAAIAEKHGFTCVTPTLLSGEEEAAIFHQAKIICGSSGGGILNCVYSKPGTRVICYGAEDDLNWPLQGICTAAGLNLLSFRGPQFSSIDRFWSNILSTYAIDLITLEEILAAFD